MKCFVVLATILALDVAQGYETKNDGFDVEGLAADHDQLVTLIHCISEKAPCTDAIAEQFHKDLPDAVVSACAKCTDRQKHNVRVVLEAAQKTLPEDYQVLKQKLDPENKHFEGFLAAIAKA